MPQSQLLRRFVMQAMADDYEDLEHVFEGVSRLSPQHGGSASREDLLQIVEQVIKDGLAQAYVLSSEPPYATPVPFSRTNWGDLWFYLTAKGLASIKRVLSAEQQN